MALILRVAWTVCLLGAFVACGDGGQGLADALGDARGGEVDGFAGEVDASDAGAEVPPLACPACEAYGDPVVTGVLAEGGPLECSGLAASRVHPGVVYAHSDSGDLPRFFALAPDGSLRGEFRLDPAPFAVDWEDMAVGPCDGGSCLFIGDVGNNSAARPSGVPYAVAEPDALAASAPVDPPWTSLPFRYPDGSHNCETLLVHPLSGDVYLVRKSDVEWGAYRLPTPHTPGEEATLVKVGVVPAPAEWGTATGGDIHPCGDRLLLRSYGRLIELRQPADQPFDAVFGTLGVEVPVANESGGEAVAYDADGLGYTTISEGAGVPVHHVGCVP